MTLIGNYHYKVMSFGLKNAGSTYQRMMTRMLEPQLGKNIEIYFDDMMVKSKMMSEQLGDLDSTFNVLRKHKLRLKASNALLAWDQASFWATWLLTGGLRSTLTRSRPLTT